MNLTTYECVVSADFEAAMQRGLEAIGQPDVDVLVSGDFVQSVQRLDPSVPYDTNRGFGVVGAKTVRQEDQTAILVNYDVMSKAPEADVERLLAHEGGHALLHARGEAMPALPDGVGTSGLAWLRGIAWVVIEEFRIERRVGELGYPPAGLAAIGSVDDHVFDFCCEVFEASFDPASADVENFANRIFVAQNRLTNCLAYLAGAVLAGQVTFSVDKLSSFGQQYWGESIARNWQERLDLYDHIPSAGTPWGGPAASTRVREAAELERKLLLDVGFTVQSNDLRPGSPWSFRPSSTEEVFRAQLDSLLAEMERRGV